MVSKKLQRDKLKGKTGGYEKRMKKSRESVLAKKGQKEMNKRGVEDREILKWEKEKKEYFIRIEIQLNDRNRESKEFLLREKESGREEQWEKIENLKYNKWYK